ncbi:MAG: protein kinase [Planctomycetes bacterium]|nr:protein kinase [Planctomycetota bacterium]
MIDREQRTAELGKTVPSEAFGASGDGAVPADDVPTGMPPLAPSLHGKNLGSLLRAHGYQVEERDADDQRFALHGVIGSGATASVFSAFDRSLAREIAVKVLARSGPDATDDVRHFVDEARVTASLQHPNVLPVHEIDVADSGLVYFTMKKIEGRSLGDVINASAPGARSERLASFSSVAALFMSVGHALAYAHHRGVIHQDVKPDNIMIGDFGEVLLVDWGSAARIDGSDQRLYGTPLYMAPEQARLERVDIRTDIYCLGATLFHALILRIPTWDDGYEEFWAKKRAGRIDPLTADERAAVPAPILDIALKAMAPRAQDRYQRVDDLIRDLERYVAGLAVSAHRDTWLEIAARWHRRHARSLWSGVGALAVIAILGALLYGERLQRIATWGAPIAHATFSDDSWQDDWTVNSGVVTRENGELIASRHGETMIEFKRRLPGDVAIEFDGETPVGTSLGDISVFWSRDGALHDDKWGEKQGEVYHLQFGAHGGSYSRITAPGGRTVAMSRFKPEKGRRYRIRAEIIDSTMNLLIDGRLICTFTDELAHLGGGWISIYTYYQGKRLDNLRVFARGVPQQLPGTAIADHLVRAGQDDQAIAEYRRLSEVHAGTALAEEARYKQGLCEYRSGAFDAAFATWAPITGSRWTGLIEVRRIDRDYATADHDRALERLAVLHPGADEALRRQIASGWNGQISRLANQVVAGADPAVLARYVAVHDRIMPDDILTAAHTAEALFALKRYDEVIARFPFLPFAILKACSYAGRIERVPDLVDEPTIRASTLHGMGLPQRRIDECAEASDGGEAMIDLGRAEELLTDFDMSIKAGYATGRFESLLATTTSPMWRSRSLAMLGRTDEIPAPSLGELWAMMATRRFDEAMATYGNHLDAGMWPRHQLGLQAYIAGDHDEAFRLFTVPEGWEFRQHQQHFPFAHYVMVPFLQELAGDAQAIPRMRAAFETERRYVYGQVPWHYLRLLTGEFDDARFRQQQMRRFLEADLILLTAIRRERAQDPAGAADLYARYAALPIWQRVFEPDPVIDGFVVWRREMLGR